MEIGKLIEDSVGDRPGQSKVLRFLLESGMSIVDGCVCCGGVKINHSSLAESVGVDRRIVAATIETVQRDAGLRKVFENLTPTANFKNVAKALGWGVISLKIKKSGDKPGSLARIIEVIADSQTNIKQVVVEDVEDDVKTAYIITGTPLSGMVYQALKDLEVVETITIH
ncbi:MAG: hypothetical protein QCI38_03725 [Candidatus Thermoplasmatota archaeon]|nr:hypothetical protein [Candidatus Thermoplasmatota archaeon]